MHRVDLNCDLGESFGSYRLGNDEKVLQFVTSANIACGYHGGDPGVMRRTVRLALEHGVAIGAHPGYPDLQGFGRRFMDVSPQEAEDMVLYQIGALSAFVKAEGGTLRHVKPHGALYNAAVADDALAEAIARAVQRYDPDLILFGLSGSSLVAAGEKVRVRTASEAFADRTYQSDGSLTSRRDPDALIEDHEVAVKQATRLVKEGRVASRQGTDVEVSADTICIHGDGPHAVEFARLIRTRLPASGIEVAPIGGP